MKRNSIKWATVGIAATALIGTAAFTAMAGSPPDAIANKSWEVASYEAAGNDDGSVVVTGQDNGETLTFTVEDGKLMDDAGNVLGNVGEQESKFEMTDSDGNPIQVTVVGLDDDGNTGTAVYAITENIEG